MSSVNTQDDVYNLTYKTLTERFQYYLQDSSEPGKKEFGIIVGDHRGAQDDKRLRQHHQMLMHSSASVTSSYRNLIEGLFLEPSHMSIGIQLADMVAGAVWRAYQKNDYTWYNLLQPSIRANSNHQVDGYGIIKVPKKNWI